MSLDINTAGSEFVKSVLKRYRSAKYFREKEILAQKLLNAAIEAGSLITELSFCPEAKEDAVARKAMEELSKAMFVLKVMSDEGVYPQRRVEPVIDLSREVKEIIEPYLSDERPQEAPVTPPVQPSVPQLTEEIKVTEFVDRGGFEEVYKGEEE